MKCSKNKLLFVRLTFSIIAKMSFFRKMGLGRVVFKTVRVGLGTAAVFASIQGLVDHSFDLIFENFRKIPLQPEKSHL